jgi:hypothetical protein
MPVYNSPCITPYNDESLAVATVKWQPVGSKTYDIEKSFMRGTIYPALDKPFLGKGGCCQ